MSGALLQDEVFSILFQVRPSVTMNYLFCGIEQWDGATRLWYTEYSNLQSQTNYN